MRITSVIYDANSGGLTLTWDSAPGASYNIQYTQDVAAAATDWDTLTSGIPSGGATTTFVVDTTDAGTYYRIMKQ